MKANHKTNGMGIVKLLFLGVIFLLWNGPAKAQDYHVIDSLQQKLKEAGSDEKKSLVYTQLSRAYWYSNTDTAMLFAKEAVSFAEKSGDKLATIDAYNIIANVYMDKNEGKTAVECANKGLRIAEALGNETKIYRMKYTLGYIYLVSYNHEDALKNILECLNYYERIGDHEFLPGIYHNVAVCYLAIKNKDLALRYLKKAYVMNHKAGYTEWESRNLYQIAAIYYYNENNPKRALPYFVAAKNEFLKINDKASYAMAMVGVGATLAELGKYHEAMDTLSIALADARKRGDKNGVAWAYNHMGLCLTLEKKYKEAAICLDSCLRLCRELNSMEAMRNVYERLYQLDSASGNKAQAFEHYRAYIGARDSLANSDKLKETSNLFMRFEFAQKEAQIKAEQEIKDIRESNIRYASFAGLLILGLFLVLVYRQRNRLNKEKQKSDNLLRNMLPEEVAEELKTTGKSNARLFEEVSILFTDFVDFTKISEDMSAEALVNELHACFSGFDQILEKHGLEKIKTIGDAYMAAAGMPTPNPQHAVQCVAAAREIVQFMKDRKAKQKTFDIRIGIHSGPVVAGIVGLKKFAYDVWGDTVNTAARMEQNSSAGKINISDTTYLLVKNHFSFTPRGKIQVKGKGEMEMYFFEN